MLSSIIALSYFSASVLFALLGLQCRRSYRPFLFLPHGFFGSLAFCRITDVTTSPAHASIIGMFFCVWICHMSYVLCLEGSSYVEPIEKWNWHRAYKMCWNTRWLHTAHEAPLYTKRKKSPEPTDNRSISEDRAVTPTSSENDSPKRRTFLLPRLAAVAIIYASYIHLNHAISTLYPLSISDFEPRKTRYLRRLPSVSPREAVVRTVAVLNFFWNSWAIMTCYHHSLSIFFVALGLDGPSDWPTLYGSPWEMYSVRRFWGKFWHRVAFRTYVGYGNLVAEKVLRVKRGSVVHKLCVEFTVFLVSGIAHGMTTWTMGYYKGYWEDVLWFCANFAAFVLEMGFQVVCGRVLPKRGGVVYKALGAVWLFAFFFLTLPKSVYPKVWYGTTV